MFQDISQSVVLIAFVWGPLVYAREHNGTLMHTYVHKGGPSRITHSSSGFEKIISDVPGFSLPATILASISLSFNEFSNEPSLM